MPTSKEDELRYEPRNYGKSFKQWQIFIDASRRGESAVYRTPEGDICSPKRVEQLIHAREKAVTTLQPFEVQNYKRLMALESRGIKEYNELREAPALSAERVVSFINQLSPWNLKTTGIDILNTYVQSQLKEDKEE